MSDRGLLTRRRLLAMSIVPLVRIPGLHQGSEKSLVFDHVSVLDGSGRFRPDHTVTISGSRIVAVGASASAMTSAGAHVVDGRGKFLIPGLWDMHGHLSYTKASALPILLANGITGFRDCGAALDEVDSWRAEIRAGIRRGPRIFRCGPALTARTSPTQRAVPTETEARVVVRELVRSKVDFIKVHAAIPRAAYFAVADESKRLSTPFAGHLPRAVTAEEASDARQASFEHIDTLLDGKMPENATNDELAAIVRRFRTDRAPRLFDRFIRNGNWFTPTLSVSTFPYLSRLAALATGAPLSPHDRYVSQASKATTAEIVLKYQKELKPSSVARFEGTFDEYLKLVKTMHAAGVPLMAGSDFATSVTYPGFDLHDELGLLVQAGLSPGDALLAATVNPTRFLGEGELGSIEAGKIADLVLLDGNPVVDISRSKAIRAVVSDGVLLDRAELDQLLAVGEKAAQEPV